MDPAAKPTILTTLRPPGDQWACASCTYKNSPAHTRCAICDADKVDVDKVDASAHSASQPQRPQQLERKGARQVSSGQSAADRVVYTHKDDVAHSAPRHPAGVAPAPWAAKSPFTPRAAAAGPKKLLPVAASREWACRVCTFLNPEKPSLSRCEMCAAPKPSTREDKKDAAARRARAKHRRSSSRERSLERAERRRARGRSRERRAGADGGGGDDEPRESVVDGVRLSRGEIGEAQVSRDARRATRDARTFPGIRR